MCSLRAFLVVPFHRLRPSSTAAAFLFDALVIIEFGVRVHKFYSTNFYPRMSGHICRNRRAGNAEFHFRPEALVPRVQRLSCASRNASRFHRSVECKSRTSTRPVVVFLLSLSYCHVDFSVGAFNRPSKFVQRRARKNTNRSFFPRLVFQPGDLPLVDVLHRIGSV
jgi:hypothetical protein